MTWFSTKKIIAIMLTTVFCYLSIKGVVSSTEFLTVFTMIVSFYFGQSTARDTLKDSSTLKVENHVNEENNSQIKE
ncbi:hypothetical protein SAMN05660865_01226 [Caloramator fervidus]|uniref:Uncharacterized protein n=1 Tax=Caloramator fervidus TaxID=29344 RepID=A0A1H5VJ44_9CLOT|nr:hypothetical protein [Caloramator fervidus]SEF87385.1 hypothetical protein SAMN05660865_01226 [Caloramator fervidus]